MKSKCALLFKELTSTQLNFHVYTPKLLFCMKQNNQKTRWFDSCIMYFFSYPPLSAKCLCHGLRVLRSYIASVRHPKSGFSWSQLLSSRIPTGFVTPNAGRVTFTQIFLETYARKAAELGNQV